MDMAGRTLAEGHLRSIVSLVAVVVLHAVVLVLLLGHAIVPHKRAAEHVVTTQLDLIQARAPSMEMLAPSVPLFVRPQMLTSPPPQIVIQSGSALPASIPPSVAPVPSQPLPSPSAKGSSTSRSTIADWQRQVLNKLDQYKHYPPIARLSREEGVVYLRLVMNREGGVLDAVVARSSGFDALDTETLALVHRAGSLPPPPADISDPVTLIIPIRFSLM